MGKPEGATGPVLVGRYAMYGEIGAGGMATVHLGRALPGAGDAGRVVAIKRLRPHFAADAEVATSFLDEARLSARVRHPHVVATLDVVTRDAEAFLVMEYVDGVSLASLTRGPRGPVSRAVPPAIAASIAAGMLLGLHAAHEATSDTGEPLRIVHRDVSPQNVLVGIDGVARVLDFGVAKALGRQQTTRDGRVKGKLGYMAPEQLSGRGVTRRTDVFAAGIVLWEMLAGKRLFRADDEAATVARVLMSEVRPPSEMSPESPAGLDAVVLRALERDPSKRFVSAEEMARAIEQVQPPADVASVAAWVKQTAAEELARRAEGVRALAVDLVEDGTLVTAPPRLRRRWIPAAAVAVSIAGFALVQWGLLAPSRATTAASAAASGVPSAAPAVAPPAVVPADVSPPAPSTAALTLPAVAPSTVPTPTRPPARRPAPKPTTGRREHLYSQD